MTARASSDAQLAQLQLFTTSAQVYVFPFPLSPVLVALLLCLLGVVATIGFSVFGTKSIQLIDPAFTAGKE